MSTCTMPTHVKKSKRSSAGLVEKLKGTFAIDIPADLMMLIMQKLSFPHCFKARLLNREWRREFPERVRSHTWPIFCPALMSPGGQLNGFDRSTGCWTTFKFETVPIVDPSNTYRVFGRPPTETLQGALFCMTGTSADGVTATVINLLSGERRVISCPFQECWFSIFRLVGKNRYQLLAVGVSKAASHNYRPPGFWTYDSNSHSWSDMSRSWTSNHFSSGGNLLACLLTSARMCYTLWDQYLFVCRRRAALGSTEVYRANLESGSESTSDKVSVGLPDGFESFTLQLLNSVRHLCGKYGPQESGHDVKSAADSEYIYLCDENLVSYHLESGSWHNHGYIPTDAHNQCDHKKMCKVVCTKFEPGFNPFMAP
ncbi:hypothetical protein R1sor_016514 [Riccia sorocarpa]|uniref:F-box domain-containing protein n=1 Tax=Riccia sorocarpa TaxID=122646 RepID=A0ABD3HIR3_9MARC